jgi:HEAT repeat protein
VISALAEYGNDAAAALPLVRRYIDFDYSMSVSGSAIYFVGVLRDKKSLEVLTNLMTSKANIWWLLDAKRSAVEALGRIADPSSASVLEECARTESDELLRDAARQALARIQAKSR